MQGVVRLVVGVWCCAVVLLGSAAVARAQPVLPIDHITLMQTVREGVGKVIVVNFFATWCQPCLIEIPGLKKLRTEFAEEDVTIMSVSVDQQPEVLPAFVKRMAFNYPVYHAKPGVARFFSVGAIPKMLVYDASGTLAIEHDGFLDPKILRQEVQQLLEQQ